MKIGLISSVNPLGEGGYRFIVEWTKDELTKRGYQAEILYLPASDDPDILTKQMLAFRTIRLEHYYDRVITFRPPAHVVMHSCKIVWFIHHVRIFYDLWQHEYCPVVNNVAGRALRDEVRRQDTIALGEAHRLYANSQTVATRIARFNGLDARVLYPPILNPERFYGGEYGDEVVCVCRMEPHKRQDLLIEAIAESRSAVRLRLCGPSATPAYVERLKQLCARRGIQNRVTIDDRWINEVEKQKILSRSLAAAYVPLDEDSYGYPVLEAAHARRCTVSVTDGGGVREFIIDGENGMIVDPQPRALAAAFDMLYDNRLCAGRLGKNARSRIADLRIGWDRVIDQLTS